mmetsp:Transcript_25004/g.34804  ORF Transcript_25004/g.34804 Transcript_25004/m.34804 type:complete len:435 (-) Transcript_25004:331-1635(-)|eukprot:CAMPEP_0184482414 /NCGR_PEP_ID=MMETSP0113_2-20130426/3964_1 /TAXON_ID=91329 /ORGANISM="Norrisiella sphaerica, Strain BC52" /LENGTH=434 /DNA_ID=CAMNT_0026862121 /DNA_START=50 /DNA_END=1354 /DNA_ORIENTATION=-
MEGDHYSMRPAERFTFMKKIGLATVAVVAFVLMMASMTNYPTEETHIQPVMDAESKAAPAPPTCLQWLAGNCVSWNGKPPPGSGPPPPPPMSSGGGGGGGGGGGSQPDANPYAPPPKPHIVYRAPCNTSECCRHFFPGNKNVGLSSMYDPRCVLDLPPHENCIEFFMCSFCCKVPLNGACPMKDRTCNSLSEKKIKKILADAQKEEEEKSKEAQKRKAEKEAEEKKKKSEEKTKKEENAKKNEEEKKKEEKMMKADHKKDIHWTAFPTPLPTLDPTHKPTPAPTASPAWRPPCKDDGCCNHYWPGSIFDEQCKPGGQGHLGCVGGFTCIYNYNDHEKKAMTQQSAQSIESVPHIETHDEHKSGSYKMASPYNMETPSESPYMTKSDTAASEQEINAAATQQQQNPYQQQNTYGTTYGTTYQQYGSFASYKGGRA